MFQFENVDKVYDNEYALRDIQLEISEGEHVAVIGPSGAGKTTLLHLMAGMFEPDRGIVSIDGRPLYSLKNGRDRSHLVGIMHQQFDLVDELPVIHNVLAGQLGRWTFLQSLRSLLFPRDQKRAEQALERVGIPDKIYDKTAHLSGGEQQRVALARLLVQDPQNFLADEPVASVDPARARSLLEMLLSIATEKNRTLVVSLHSVHYALEYFPRIIGLRKGQVKVDQPSDQINEDELEELYELSEELPTP